MLNEALKQTQAKQIVDLCSGGGGPVQEIQKGLSAQFGNNIPIVLTDIFPNIEAYTHIASTSDGAITFCREPVDATDMAEDLTGFRTLFSSFHHFKPEQAKKILRDAVDKRQGIAIFDGGDKGLLISLGIIIFQPILFLLFTPFFRPFRLSRLLFTYIIPVIPLCTIWDGVVSMMRLYRPKELMQLTKEIQADSYLWQAGRLRTGMGMHLTYLIGYERKQ